MKNMKKTAAAAEEVKEAVRTVETKAEEEVIEQVKVFRSKYVTAYGKATKETVDSLYSLLKRK